MIGASSGIGRSLAKVLAENGYAVGLAARRFNLLQQLQKEIPSQTYIKQIDVSRVEEAMSLLQELIEEMGGMDLIVLNAGINTHNTSFSWKGEIDTIDVNVSGFAAMANVAVKYFLQQNSGHLVGISSVAALRGSATSPAYSASKAFVSNYLEGLKLKVNGDKIYVTDIRPGLVDTALIRGNSWKFWVASPEKAAQKIFQAVRRKKKVAYIGTRWGIIAWIAKLLPDGIYKLRYRS